MRGDILNKALLDLLREPILCRFCVLAGMGEGLARTLYLLVAETLCHVRAAGGGWFVGNANSTGASQFTHTHIHTQDCYPALQGIIIEDHRALEPCR